jgi:hypothetical protein
VGRGAVEACQCIYTAICRMQNPLLTQVDDKTLQERSSKYYVLGLLAVYEMPRSTVSGDRRRGECEVCKI